jgi:hypothetical protein
MSMGQLGQALPMSQPGKFATTELSCAPRVAICSSTIAHTSFKIDPEVLVNDHVSEPDYLLPRDLTVSLAQFWGYPPAGLA